jgi:hypothetical protein
MVKMRSERGNGTKINVAQRFRGEMGGVPQTTFIPEQIASCHYEESILKAEVHSIL